MCRWCSPLFAPAGWAGWLQPFFEIESYRVHVEERVGDGEPPLAEATVKVRTKGSRHIESAEGQGPVGALDNALRKALANDYPELDAMTLEDYRVRVLDETHGTGAVVRRSTNNRAGAASAGPGIVLASSLASANVGSSSVASDCAVWAVT